jgi:hypothetical protein
MVKLFALAWIVVGAISVTAYLIRQENKFAAGIVALAGLILAAPFIREWIRRKKEGFYVKTTGSAEGGDVIYDEGGKSLTFYFDRGERRIYVPSDHNWNARMPEWARGRKIEILGRISQRMGRDWGFEEKID